MTVPLRNNKWAVGEEDESMVSGLLRGEGGSFSESVKNKSHQQVDDDPFVL